MIIYEAALIADVPRIFLTYRIQPIMTSQWTHTIIGRKLLLFAGCAAFCNFHARSIYLFRSVCVHQSKIRLSIVCGKAMSFSFRRSYGNEVRLVTCLCVTVSVLVYCWNVQLYEAGTGLF